MKKDVENYRPLSSFVILSCSSRDDMSTKWTRERK